MIPLVASADLYAALLWLALGALGVSVVSLLLGWVKPAPPARRISFASAAAAFLLAGLAGILHDLLDHAPGQVNPLTLGAFLDEHRAPGVISACALLAMLTSRVPRRVRAPAGETTASPGPPHRPPPGPRR